MIKSVSRSGSGLVIGKFYPLHLGHVALFEFAAKQVDTLYIIVCHSDRYAIPGELRKTWVEKTAPLGAKIILIDEHHADDDSKGWAERTIQVLGFAPDKVFTSESYGVSFCAHLGSQHIPFDLPREKWPVSGTEIRFDSLRNWKFLPKSVRGYYARRIAVVGSESSGKSTLAQALAQAYQTMWVPEYGRFFWEAKRYDPPTLTGQSRKWEEDEFVHIAQTQNALEDEYAERTNRILICDTTALCTGVWHQRYLGYRSPKVDALAKDRKYALTFFCEPDFPFVQDGTRDGESIRDPMANWMKDRLREEGIDFSSLTGTIEERLMKARAIIDGS